MKSYRYWKVLYYLVLLQFLMASLVVYYHEEPQQYSMHTWAGRNTLQWKVKNVSVNWNKTLQIIRNDQDDQLVIHEKGLECQQKTASGKNEQKPLCSLDVLTEHLVQCGSLVGHGTWVKSTDSELR